MTLPHLLWLAKLRAPRVQFQWLWLSVFFLISCSEPLYWAKPGANAGGYEQDVTECQQSLGMNEGDMGAFNVHSFSASVGTDSVAMEQCLAEKGWFLARKTKD